MQYTKDILYIAKDSKWTQFKIFNISGMQIRGVKGCLLFKNLQYIQDYVKCLAFPCWVRVYEDPLNLPWGHSIHQKQRVGSRRAHDWALHDSGQTANPKVLLSLNTTQAGRAQVNEKHQLHPCNAPDRLRDAGVRDFRQSNSKEYLFVLHVQ